MKKGQIKISTVLITGILIIVVMVIVIIAVNFLNKPSVTGNAINIPSTSENSNKTENIQEIVCNSPYIRVGTDCCLDKNNNKICDKEDVETIKNSDNIVSNIEYSVPTPSLKLTIDSINYNKANGLLEVTYKSDSNAPAYFKGTFTLISGGDRNRVGDVGSVFIAPGDYKTILYSIKLTNTDNIQAEIYTLYGESSESLDKILTKTVNVGVVDYIDRCKFSKENIKSISYDKQGKEFVTRIENTNSIGCFVDIELNNFIVGNTNRNIGSGIAILIPVGRTEDISIKENIDDSDLGKNDYVKITLNYGEKEDVLVNKLIIDKLKLQYNLNDITGSAFVNPPWYIIGSNIKTTGITLDLKNNAGQNYDIQAIYVSGCGWYNTITPIPVDSESIITVPCTLNSGTNFKGDITITYRIPGVAVDITSTGTISSKVM